MKEMVIYNLIALLIIGASIFSFIRIKKGALSKKMRLLLEIILIVLIVSTIFSIAFLDMIALGIIGPVPN